MTVWGSGRAALADDPATAERLGWGRRRRSLPDPEVLLRPREGDPSVEPWIAPPGFRPTAGAEALWSRRGRDPWHTYLPQVPGVVRYLKRIQDRPSLSGVSVAITGMGRVGGAAATLLSAAAASRSRIREILIRDEHAENQERWRIELSAIAEWRGREPLPEVRTASLDEMLSRADIFLFAAADSVPPVGWTGDVRMVQYAPNRAILRACLERARASGFTGLFLIVSDPVDCLAMAAFHDSNAGPGGAFEGHGLAPERIGGLALGVMWARALAHAREEGWEERLLRRGGVYGPHTDEVLVFDDLLRPDPRRSASLTRAAREGNLQVRAAGFLPYVGPAVSSLALALPRMLSGREVLASVFLGGLFFGGPARLGWGMHPVPRRAAPAVRYAVEALHQRMASRLSGLGLAFES